MESEIKEIYVCVKFINNKKSISKVLMIYENGNTRIVNKETADMMIKNFPRDEVYSKVHFLSEDKYNFIRDKYVKKHKKEINKKRRKTKIKVYSAILTVALGTGIVLVSNNAFNKDNDDGFKVKINRGVEEITNDNLPVIELAKEKDFYELINMSNKNTSIQSDEFMDVSAFLIAYNGAFSNKHKENGIKPTLKWNEVISLKLAYNKYTDPEIKVMFNGKKLDLDDVKDGYSNAVKQLTDAFVIENEKCIIPLNSLNNNALEKRIYDEVNLCFLKAKNSNKKADVKELYKKINKYKHKNSVMFMLEPIVKASNKLFKYKDNDIINYYEEIDYRNYINNRFRDYVSLSSDYVNDKLPLYDQFKDSKEKQLKEEKMYNTKNRNINHLSEYEDIIGKKESSKVYTYSKI